jgi:hypothetical protein
MHAPNVCTVVSCKECVALSTMQMAHRLWLVAPQGQVPLYKWWQLLSPHQQLLDAKHCLSNSSSGLLIFASSSLQSCSMVMKTCSRSPDLRVFSS